MHVSEKSLIILYYYKFWTKDEIAVWATANYRYLM